ncbi:MAG: 30S ribosomal protein S12 methylthiotransferase RimO [Phycisphaerales bacterium]|nr:30S ribosomal protein S12 methylthiotransferase RimO [Phycisphaerales bacterium]
MKTHILNQSVNIITLGCSKNLVDSEEIAAQLKANNIPVAHEHNKHNHATVIVNTCGFIDKAKEESIQTILQQVELKKRGKINKLFVTGCLSERYRESLSVEIPEVDAWFGTLEMQPLLAQLHANYKKELIGERLLYTPNHYAYLKISEGCNRTCAFCAIPLMRGKHKSKTIEDIVKEAQLLIAKGVKEIILIAQELTYYGLDIYKKRKLADLLKILSDLPNLEWIRLHYLYPSQFPVDILDVIKERPNICKYLDIPLQHASNRILEKMHRQITKEEMNRLIDHIRNTIPNICLRTTFIVGFPSETEKDLDELGRFIEYHRFDRIGVFQYSHEENTTAYQFTDDVTESEKLQRSETIMSLQEPISYEKNLAKVGKTFKVLVDKKEAGKFIGRTEFDSIEVDNEVIIEPDSSIKLGSFYNIRISKAYNYDLEGYLKK